MRRSLLFLSWQSKLRVKLDKLIHKYVPDPRIPDDGSMADYEELKRQAQSTGGEVLHNFKKGQSLEEYMAERDKAFIEQQRQTLVEGLDGLDVPRTKSGIPFQVSGSGTRQEYMNLEDFEKSLQKKPEATDYNFDEEKLLIRRQLQMENEQEYRKFTAEMKRDELDLMANAKRRRAHSSDPHYDPFQWTPGYRPQDCKALAKWLKRQHSSGKSASGLSLKGKDGQDRFYNEQRMATQFYSNPFATRVEMPVGFNALNITAASPDSFFINNKEVIGSVIVTPTRYYHWNVSSFEDLNERTLAVLLHMYPVPDCLFLGTGREAYMLDEDLIVKFAKRGTVVHCLCSRQAAHQFGNHFSIARRCVAALINPIPTNSFKKECFGDFIENDMFALSDGELGINPIRTFAPQMLKQSTVAEKYRSVQGTGFGPRYHIMADGRMVRPSSAGTTLRPLLEPGEIDKVEWDKLPSYFNWYPKEHVYDYIENNTYRETKGVEPVDPGETRISELFKTSSDDIVDESADESLMPWDSRSIPVTKHRGWKHRDGIISICDGKTGRVVGVTHEGFELYKKMMTERAEGKEESDPIEFDQERFVADEDGFVYDMVQSRFLPAFECRWHPKMKKKRGHKRNNE